MQGAVTAKGVATLSFYQCQFVGLTVGKHGHNNLDEHLNGGVLYVRGAATLIIDACLFKANVAVHSNSAGGFGGVVYSEGVSLIKISCSTFTQNSAYHGGVLYLTLFGEPTDRVEISSSVFDANTAEHASAGRGGSLYLREGCRPFTKCDRTVGYAGTLEISASTFIDGSSENGGVMYDRNARLKVNISSSSFTGNTVSSPSGVWSGAGVFHVKGLVSLTVVSSLFQNNSARDGGGVLYTDSYSITRIMLLDSTFLYNRVSGASQWDGKVTNGFGGAVYIGVPSSHSVSFCTFVGNRAPVRCCILPLV